MGDENRKNPFCNLHEDHYCIQQLSINDIKNAVKNIEDCVEKLTTQQSKFINLVFGDDMEGGIVTEIARISAIIKGREESDDKATKRIWQAIYGIISSLAVIGTGTIIWVITQNGGPHP